MLPAVFLPRLISHMFGLPLVGGGLLFFHSSLRTMRRAGTDVRPDKPKSNLVVADPCRFTPDPIYLGFTLFYGGIIALANSLPSALLLPFVLMTMRRGVIEPEERYLERVFGEEYLRYKHGSGAGSEFAEHHPFPLGPRLR